MNLGSVEEAEGYQQGKGLSGGCPHGASSAAARLYNINFIPHKVIIGKDGMIIKNDESASLEEVEALM